MAQNARKILIVDDDAFTRDRLAKLLVAEGYVVETVASASDGYERCAKAPRRYGLVFMDVRFPEGAVGYRVARHIARFRHDGGPRVIGMTGHSDLYDYENRLEHGMVDVIMKPLHEHLVTQLTHEHFLAAA
jgi:CheY-like chemotaxis protein